MTLTASQINVEPRTAKLEEHLVIDESDPANPTVSIKPGVKFIVTGGGAIFKETPTIANNV
eukprot:CAMPEP_0184501572 /NCGR_PEP_ID=MMETSP0113_2-20130426/48046_1 /TAXON_ID=91329 /ORGANISM="Norrisiella sphaerica, Strain BC52" /LENGTH=60 /DNA_ID=CAMNT_0026890381 /DNA_START=196 /DNA_END=375 /DNA_ORIENTATION=+